MSIDLDFLDSLKNLPSNNGERVDGTWNETHIVCNVCGETIPADSHVCPICGESPIATSIEHAAVQKEKKSKHIFAPALDSIFWDQGNANELVYKYPKNGITLGCVLTVRESQEAYFFKNGVLCDKFTAGRHVLSTQNLPLQTRLSISRPAAKPRSLLKFGL